jgi:sensor histidine kinase regulating citrate/malate metabolism
VVERAGHSQDTRRVGALATGVGAVGIATDSVDQPFQQSLEPVALPFVFVLGVSE